MPLLGKSASNGFRKRSLWEKVPQTDSENAPSEKKCLKRIPKTLPLGKSASNGFRKRSLWEKVLKRIPFIGFSYGSEQVLPQISPI
jgi:hypothetical protein